MKTEKILWDIDEVMNSYPTNFTTAFWRSVELKMLTKYLPYFKGEIVDIGCGDGLFAALLFGYGKIAVGYDVNKKTLKSARERGTYRAVIVADARSNPFLDTRFDVLFSNCAIEHIPDIDQCFHEFHRILKPGGFVLFTVPSSFFYYDFWVNKLSRYGLRRLSEMWINRHCRLREHLNIWRLDEWRIFLEKHGIVLIAYEYYFNPMSMFWWSLLEDAHSWPFKAGVLLTAFDHKFGRLVRGFVNKQVSDDEYLCNKSKRGAGLLVLAKKQSAED